MFMIKYKKSSGEIKIHHYHHHPHHVHEGLGVFPQDEVGPSISSSVVLCSFVLLIDTIPFVFVFYLCPSSVRFVATFPGLILPFLLLLLPPLLLLLPLLLILPPLLLLLLPLLLLLLLPFFSL